MPMKRPSLPFSRWRAGLGLCLALAASSVFAQAPAAGTEASGSASAQWIQRMTDDKAWEAGHWRGAVAPYAPHWRPSAEHQYVWAVGLERQRADDWLGGASFFSNSFGQPSAYVYLGKRFPQLLGQPQLFGQLSAGVLYGYVGKYKKKVPLNVNGFSPGALASVGWQFTPELSLTMHLLGDAGAMFQLGWDFK